MCNPISKIFKNLFTASKKTNMEKEIFEQPETVSKLIKKYISKNGTINIDLPDNIKKVFLVASGSSYHSATIAANYLRDNVHCYAQSYYASEFSLLDSVDVDNQTLYVFISQSGETADTNKSLDLVKARTDKILAITNTKNSTLYNNAKYKLLLHAGEEKSIASTKAMCAQIFCLFLIAVKIMQQREIPANKLLDELYAIPQKIENVLKNKEQVKSFAKRLSSYDNAAVLASGMFYPLAKEGALKIKETSYINTTAYPTGEFLHGHIAILNKKCAVISIVNNFNVDFTIRVLDKIRSEYTSDSLVISAFDLNLKKSDDAICVNTTNDIEFLFSALIILQMLAFENALYLGRNIDTPSGLTKIVK